ncbi:MAG: transcription antitermination factor NusB, partial [Bryobacteraceae bacterium]
LEQDLQRTLARPVPRSHLAYPPGRSWRIRFAISTAAIAAYYGTLYSEETATRPAPDEFVEQLVKGVVENLGAIDERIARHAEHWRIERMPAVDRNVLRLAVFEMMGPKTPPPVAIDEALELARKYSGEESVHFVNGVLDAARRELEGA